MQKRAYQIRENMTRLQSKFIQFFDKQFIYIHVLCFINKDRFLQYQGYCTDPLHLYTHPHSDKFLLTKHMNTEYMCYWMIILKTFLFLLKHEQAHKK